MNRGGRNRLGMEDVVFHPNQTSLKVGGYMEKVIYKLFCSTAVFFAILAFTIADDTVYYALTFFLNPPIPYKHPVFSVLIFELGLEAF